MLYISSGGEPTENVSERDARPGHPASRSRRPRPRACGAGDDVHEDAREFADRPSGSNRGGAEAADGFRPAGQYESSGRDGSSDPPGGAPPAGHSPSRSRPGGATTPMIRAGSAVIREVAAWHGGARPRRADVVPG